jgi:iron complex outermembrane recepter protein
MSGVDVNYKQALTFLPDWARGVQVYANASALRATNDDGANFFFVPRTVNWGASLTRSRFRVQLKWNYNSRKRQGPFAGRSIEPGTYNWTAERMLMDVIGEVYFHKRWSLFANLNNIADTPSDLEIFGPSTPEYAQFRRRLNFGSLWTIGVKGTF